MLHTYITIATLATLLCGGKQSTPQKLRTDGYYLYDNGIDTFRVMPNSKDLYLATMLALQQNGLCMPGKSKCQPDSVVIIKEASALLYYVAFFSDSSGTAFERNCRDMDTRNAAIKTIHSRGLKTGKEDCFEQSERIHAISFLNDSTFTFVVQDDSRFKEQYIATLKKNCLTILDISKRPNPIPATPHTYTFIPYN